MPLNSSHLLLALEVFSASTRRSLCVMIRTAFSHARIQFNFISFVIAIIFVYFFLRNFRVGKMCLNEALEFIFGWRSCDENKYFSFLCKLRRENEDASIERVQKYFLHNFSRFISLISRAGSIVRTFQSSAQLTSVFTFNYKNKYLVKICWMLRRMQLVVVAVVVVICCNSPP